MTRTNRGRGARLLRAIGTPGDEALAAAPPPTRMLKLALALGGLSLLLLYAVAFGPSVAVAPTDGASLPLVFLTGLLAGGLTCLAVQGGLLATTLAQRGLGDDPAASPERAAPIAMFLGALRQRLVSLFGHRNVSDVDVCGTAAALRNRSD